MAIVLTGLVIILITILLCIYLINIILIKKEEKLLENPIGQMVDVDGKNMCVYCEGEGKHTIVFLSGSGTASPIIDFKPLYKKLSGSFKTVVIEKFGYGYSDIVDDERDFDTIVRQDRQALAKAGVTGKLILCPHSMSGLEAILWAKKYPDEIEAIVGLDMAVPRTYDLCDTQSVLKYEKLAEFGRIIGLARFYYRNSSFPDAFTKEDKKLYRAIACKIAMNKTVRNEGLAIPDACMQIDKSSLPDVPTLLFVSKRKRKASQKHLDSQLGYASQILKASVVQLNCGHYVHWFEYDRISTDVKSFVESLG